MVITNGSFTKKTYCQNCFNVIEWDGPEAEQFISGHKIVKCPVCGAYIKVNNGIEYVEKDVIENPGAYMDGKAYETAAAAISAAQPGSVITFDNDETINYVSLKKDVQLDLNGHTLTTNYSIYAKGDTVISNGTVKGTRASDLFMVSGGNNLTLNEVQFESKRNGIVVTGGSSLELNDCNGSAQEAMIYTERNGNIVINGGEYTAIDNGVIMDNGTEGKDGNKIVINDGHFIGHITSAGYLAHIIYLANKDELTINGGIFEVENGTAIVVRGGKLVVSPNAYITATGDATGKVGDGATPIPAGYDIVIDKKAGYVGLEVLDVKAPGRDIFTIQAE